MKNLVLLITSCVIALAATAQNGPNIPKDYSLKKAEDYAPLKQNVIDCIKWMRGNHPDIQSSERKQAAAFVLQWVTGSPDVSVQLGTKFFTDVSGEKKNPYGADLAIMFMFGKTLYLIEHPDDKDEANAEYAGVKDMITLYEVILKRNADNKSKMMEKYVKLEKDGKLKDTVKKECDKTYKK
jgi:hypothetical protein